MKNAKKTRGIHVQGRNDLSAGGDPFRQAIGGKSSDESPQSKGNAVSAESGSGFDLEGAVGERVTRQECPEFCRRGPVNPVSLRSLRSFAAKTLELEPMNLPQRNAESTKINGAAASGHPGYAAGNTELAESGWGFDLEGVGEELLMRQKCPEMGEERLKAEG